MTYSNPGVLMRHREIAPPCPPGFFPLGWPLRLLVWGVFPPGGLGGVGGWGVGFVGSSRAPGPIPILSYLLADLLKLLGMFLLETLLRR